MGIIEIHWVLMKKRLGKCPLGRAIQRWEGTLALKWVFGR